MQKSEPVSVQRLAAEVGGRVIGDGDILIQRIANLENADEGDVAYVDTEKHFEAAAKSNASCLIIPSAGEHEPGFMSDAFIALTTTNLACSHIAQFLHPRVRREPAVHQTAVIAETADIALTAFIGPNVS